MIEHEVQPYALDMGTWYHVFSFQDFVYEELTQNKEVTSEQAQDVVVAFASAVKQARFANDAG